MFPSTRQTVGRDPVDPRSPWPMLERGGPSGWDRPCHYSRDPSSPGSKASTNCIVSEPYVTDHGSMHAQSCDLADGHCGVREARQLICQSGEETTARRDGTRAIGSDGSMSMGSPTRPIGAAAEPEFYCWVFPLSKQMNSKVNPNNKHR